MAIYHLSMKTVGRSAGRSAPAAAAYRHAECLTDERTGLVHDYTRKQGVETSLLLLPKGAPDWASERAQLWNAAEQAETRKNSTVAREIVVALPAELSARERLDLVRELGQALVERHGVAVDIAIHAPHRQGDQRNHHAHLLLTTRRLEAAGLTAKTRELDNQRSGEVEHWRATWARLANRALERAGHRERIDHRSLAEQGIDREPTQHQGPYATQLARQVTPAPEIIGLERYDDNAMVRFQNDQRERVKLELATLHGRLVEEFRVETFEPAKPQPEEIRVETQPLKPQGRPVKPLPPEVRQRVAERVEDALWALAGQQPEVRQAQVEVVKQRTAWAEMTARQTRAETEVQAWRAQNPKRAWLHDRGLRQRDLASREQAHEAAAQRSLEAEEAYKALLAVAADRHAEAYRRLEVLHGAQMREEQGRAERERPPPRRRPAIQGGSEPAGAGQRAPGGAVEAPTPTGLAVNITAVADPDHEDAHGRILDVADDAVVADTVFPELAQAGALERLANATGILQLGDAAMQEGQDAACGLRIELAEFLFCGGVELNPPGHSASSRPPRARSGCGRRGGRAGAVRPGRDPQGRQGAPEWPHGHRSSWCGRWPWRGAPGAVRCRRAGAEPAWRNPPIAIHV